MFENKKKFPLWAYPDTLEKVEELYREDNCRSQSEFIEKAVNFYIGYLTSEDKKRIPAERGNLYAQEYCCRERQPAEPDAVQAGGGDRHPAESRCRHTGN